MKGEMLGDKKITEQTIAPDPLTASIMTLEQIFELQAPSIGEFS